MIDIVDNPLEGQTIEIWLGGVFLTNVTTDSTGQFTAIHPVPADAALGPVLLETRFAGTAEYLPSQNSGTWNIFANIVVQINIETPLAVEQTTTIDGFVGDNQLNPLGGMQVLVTIEGVSIGNTTTDNNGNFSFTWQVPNIFSDGDHILVADVPAQGWYRAGQGQTTFFLAHRTGITVDIEDRDATRDDFWVVSGTLYDLDTALNDGLPGETILFFIDGVQVGSTVTSLTGEYSASIRSESSYERGIHEMTITFEGSPGHLPISSNQSVLVWAEVLVEINTVNNYVVRGDEIENRIEITGTVTEIGGQGASINNAELILGSGTTCASNPDPAVKCINVDSIIWNGPEFTLIATAPTWMQPEPSQTSVNVEAVENSSQYLLSGNAWADFTLRINLETPFDFEVDPIIEGEQEIISGEITLKALDTGEGVEGVGIQFYLEYENGSRVKNTTKTILTDEDGVAEFEFNADPPYGDASEYGELTVKMSIGSNFILSLESMNDFNTQFNPGVKPDYTYEGDEDVVPWWAYVIAVLVVGAIAAFVIMKRRAEDAAKELADIFSYTAELLAAGDSMREAIFQCYESLVHVLMGRGFLRRDFETVREFEMAIRAALPSLSEESLSALDAIFEEARYSRHEMSESHKADAQQALTRVVAEIGQVGNIPSR